MVVSLVLASFFVASDFGKTGGFILWAIFLRVGFVVLAWYLFECHRDVTEKVFLTTFLITMILGSAWLVYRYWGL